DFTQIFFCSDREGGVFNIFYVDVDYVDDEIVALLSDTEPHEAVRDGILSTPYEDKCPFIFENTLVFTSNRPGGYGGFDLYYSKLEAGQWSAPVNFGPVINSSHDDYRPILFEEEVDTDRDMMVFSSNRPGGKGGFDLYFVGVME
ncbi:MAG: PD40 domain-containing protein, partial [Bacteroidales bacterium]|nr:PD40 domain-containing protein [Bacteroidales bacterium]